MKRRSLIEYSGVCAAAMALLNTREVIAAEDAPEVKRLKEQKNYYLERHAVMHEILGDTLDPEILELVYSKFGGNCAERWGSVDEARRYKGNLEGFLKDLPSIDQWQEKAWYDESEKLITIIGKKREQCVCSMARTSGSADWCNLCCAGHQKAIFEEVLGQSVKVTMGETRLTGGERCNQYVRITG